MAGHRPVGHLGGSLADMEGVACWPRPWGKALGSRQPRSWSCPFLLPGRAVCPSSWNRGPVDAVACRGTTRGKWWSQRSRPCNQAAERARLRCRVGWRRLRLGVGYARNRPARSLHPGRGGRTRLHREGYGRVPTPGWSLRIARAFAVEDNVTRCEGRSATSVATIFNQSVDSGLAGIVGWPCSTNRLDTRRWRHGSGRSALPGVLGTG